MTFDHNNEGAELDFEDREDAIRESNEISEREHADEDAAHHDEQPYDGGGWPGDGSGTDDLADFNQMEAGDYYGE